MNTEPRPPLPGCSMMPLMRPANHAPPTKTADTKAAEKTKRSGRRATADRFAVLNAFVDAGMAGLSRVELATWLVLYRDTRNGTAKTGQADIATRVGCSTKAVKNAVAKLRKLGLLALVYRGGQNRGSSIYRVHPVPKPPKDQGKRASP